MEPTALKPRGRQSKGMYILPSLFTTANMAMGYYAILQVMHATASEYRPLDNAAASKRPKYRRISGPKYALTTVELVRSYSPIAGSSSCETDKYTPGKAALIASTRRRSCDEF